MLLRNTIQFFKIKPVASLGFLFSTSSLMLGVWAAALPFMKDRMQLSDGELGLLLLFAPIGSLTGVFLSTKVFGNIKVGNWLGIGNIAQTILFCVEVFSPYPWLFGLALYFRGMLGFLNGVASNTVAARFEKEYNRRFLSTFHAIYSVGGAIGAGIAAFMFAVHFNSRLQIVIMAVLIIIGIALLRNKYALHDYFIHSGSGFRLPNKSIVGLSFICLVVFMTEGSVVDWSSIYLKRDLLAPLSLISIGYGGFSVAMTLGRLNGDSIIPKLGEKKIIIAGTLIAALGFIIVSQSTNPTLVILGFVLSGVGCCWIVPVLFSAGANIPDVSAVQGFGMITSGGLIGFVAGPSIIGFISEQWNLSVGFLFCVGMLLLASVVGWRNRFLN
jgi:MFS family permease